MLANRNVIEVYLNRIKLLYPQSRFACNENAMGIYEVWVKVGPLTLAFRSDTSLENAVRNLYKAISNE